MTLKRLDNEWCKFCPAIDFLQFYVTLKPENSAENRLVSFEKVCCLCMYSASFDLWAWTRVARFFLVHDTKTEKCTKLTENVPIGHKISLMAIKYINIFQYKALLNIPQLRFLV
jgi:hypothetical protein